MKRVVSAVSLFAVLFLFGSAPLDAQIRVTPKAAKGGEKLVQFRDGVTSFGGGPCLQGFLHEGAVRKLIGSSGELKDLAKD